MKAAFLAVALLACLAVALAPLLLCQPIPEMISGVVLDPNRDPVPRAPVQLLDAGGARLAETSTDSRGRFRFSNLNPGSYTLRLVLPGFEPLEQAVAPGADVELVLRVAPIQERVVVTATRTEVPTQQVGASVTVLSAEELRSRNVLPVSDALRVVPGASVASSGGMGTITSLFVRGGESDYNKVLLDGIPLNQPGGAFDFNNLMTESLDYIEIVRGPQSALFGSDALGSVVQIFTRRGRADTRRPRGTLGLEGGNRETWRGHAGVSGEVSDFDYSFHASRFSTANRGPENDFHNSTLSGNFGYAFSESTMVRVVLRGELGETQTPGQTAFGRPDTGADFRRSDGAAGFTLRNQLTPGWEQRVRYSFYQSRQRSRDAIVDPPFVPSFAGRSAPFAFSDFPAAFLNNYRSHHTSYQSDWRLGSTGSAAGQHEFTFAFDWLGERNLLADRTPFGTVTEAQRNNFGYVFQWQGVWQRVFLTLGTRVEDNASFGTSVVPRASLAWFPRGGGERLGATKLKFNFGLGIKEPSLVESFSPSPFFRGNPDLLPERTRSFDFGVEQRFWYDRGKLEVNLFDNRFRDLIGFVTTDFVTFDGSFFNVGRARARGSEVILELAPAGWLRGRGSYTYLDSKVTQAGTVFDPVFEEGRPLLRRPKHSGALEVFAQWRRLTAASTTLFVGRRADSDFSFLGFTSVDGYIRWDLSGSYRTTYRVTYFATVENLLNRDHMEVLGFPALKRMFRAGARWEF